MQYTLAQVTIINTPLAYSQSKYTLRFSSLALSVDLCICLRQSKQNVPFLIFCILLNQWDLEATTALRQLWTYILRIKVSQCDHLLIEVPCLQYHNTHKSIISEYFQPLNLGCWQVEFYNCAWMFQNLTIKNKNFLPNIKKNTLVSFFCLNIYSGKFDIHHLLFFNETLLQICCTLPRWDRLLPHLAGASPKLEKSVCILNFLATNLGTEVSRANDMHEDECTSNQVFAGSDPIIMLLTQDHLTERPEAFLCVRGINPLLF